MKLPATHINDKLRRLVTKAGICTQRPLPKYGTKHSKKLVGGKRL